MRVQTQRSGLGARGSWWHRQQTRAKQPKHNLFPGSTATHRALIREPPCTGISPHSPREADRAPPVTDLPWNAFNPLPFLPVDGPREGLRWSAHGFVLPNWILEDSCLLVCTQPRSSRLEAAARTRGARCTNQREDEGPASAVWAPEWTHNSFPVSGLNTGTPRGRCSLGRFWAALIERVSVFLLAEGVVLNLKNNATPVKHSEPMCNKTGVWPVFVSWVEGKRERTSKEKVMEGQNQPLHY